MRIDRVELFEMRMPLVGEFETSFARVATREVILVAVHAEGLTGWGETPVATRPHYSHETTATAMHVLRAFLVPPLLGRDTPSVEAWRASVAWVRGHGMARAGVENALRDLFAKRDGTSLARTLGVDPSVTRIPVGVSLGIPASGDVQALVEDVARRVEVGYGRVKLKIRPGFDLRAVEAVRARFPDLPLCVDGNGGYDPGTAADALAPLDAYGLLFIEQPLWPDEVLATGRLAKCLRTPLCVDESIESPADLETCIALGASGVVNLKPGRVGGVTNALAIHDRCRDLAIPLWCGGMLETGIGRAHNVALAALPGFTQPGDLSASDRYYAEDVVDPPFRLGPGGTLAVPEGPGIGVRVLRERVERFCAARVEA